MRAETTVPSRRLIRCRIAAPLRRPGAGRLFSNQRQNPRQLAPRLAIIRRIIELIGSELEPQPENLLARLAFLDPEIGGTHLPEFAKLQGPAPPVPRRSF